MCQGPKGLSIVMVWMSLGFLVAVIGTFLPYWTKGGGLNIGLFYQCDGLYCERVHPVKTILYVIDAVILFGTAVSGLSLGFATYLCCQRFKGEEIPSYLPGCLPLFMIVASFLSLVGAIVYCTSIYNEDDGIYSLNVCPWLVISGAAIYGISCLFLPRTLKDVTSQVEPSVADPKKAKKQRREVPDDLSSEEYEQQQFKIQKYFEDQYQINQQDQYRNETYDESHPHHQQQQQQQQQQQEQHEQQQQQQQHQQQQQQQQEKRQNYSHDSNKTHVTGSGTVRNPLAFLEPRSYPYHDPDPSYPPPPYRIHV